MLTVFRILAPVFCFLFITFVPVLGATEITPESLKETEAKVKKLSHKVLPAVVSLIPDKMMGRGGSGTGVIVNKSGLILTATHVVADMDGRVTVIFPNGDRARGKVLGMDFSRDAAMVQITDEADYPFVELGKSEAMKQNDWCISLGHAGGYQADRSPPVRLGRVIKNDDAKFLVSDCTLIGGDSGGPLFDLDGKLIGIHSNIGFSLSANNHVPISTFVKTWDQLEKGEHFGGNHLGGYLKNPNRPVMGANLSDVKDKPGAFVRDVFRGSPAARAGLKTGDRIVKADDVKIKNTKELQTELNRKKPGDSVRMIIENQDGERGVLVRLVAANKLRISRPKPQPTKKSKEKTPKPDAIQEKFDKLLKEAMKKGELKLEKKDIEKLGGPQRFKKMLDKFSGSLSKTDNKKLTQMLEAPPQLNPKNHDPDALVEVGEDFFREVLDAYHPSVKKASDATHLVFRGMDLKCLCTMVHGDGYALAKASELKTENNQKLTVMIAKGKMIPAKIVKQFPKNDIALIKLENVSKMPAVAWHQPEKALPLGSFIAAAGSGPDPIAIGVVSVLPRSMSGENKGYLGVRPAYHSKGVRVAQTIKGGSARKAGVVVNDIITKVDGVVCDTPEKLMRIIGKAKPGTTVTFDYLRDGIAATRKVKLGDRSKADKGAPDRNGRMNEFGTKVSKRSSDFQSVIQTDLPISPQFCGGPVVDLDGNVIGLNISRAGRIKTYTLPSSEVVALLDRELEKIVKNATAEPEKKQAAPSK